MARSNVCPEIDPPAEPSFYAFSFTRPSGNSTPSFVIAGSGESLEGGATYAERTVRYRDLSPEGMKEKIRHVVATMEKRMGEFGFGKASGDLFEAFSGGLAIGGQAEVPIGGAVQGEADVPGGMVLVAQDFGDAALRA